MAAGVLEKLGNRKQREEKLGNAIGEEIPRQQVWKHNSILFHSNLILAYKFQNTAPLDLEHQKTN